MENQTFRSRLAALIKKSQKAIRLYSNVKPMQAAENSEFAELQVLQWKEVNSRLASELLLAVRSRGLRECATLVFALRDHFYQEWRAAETGLHTKQKELLNAAENGDYIKAALLARDLVVLKAKLQASQAAHHELQELVKRSKIVPTTIELSQDQMVEDEGAPSIAVNAIVSRSQSTSVPSNVFPLRRNRR